MQVTNENFQEFLLSFQPVFLFLSFSKRTL